MESVKSALSVSLLKNPLLVVTIEKLRTPVSFGKGNTVTKIHHRRSMARGLALYQELKSSIL